MTLDELINKLVRKSKGRGTYEVAWVEGCADYGGPAGISREVKITLINPAAKSQERFRYQTLKLQIEVPKA